MKSAIAIVLFLGAVNVGAQDSQDEVPQDEVIEGIIDGVDYYNVHLLESYDTSPPRDQARRQAQESRPDESQVEEQYPPSEYDSYQEIQTEKLWRQTWRRIRGD